MNPFAKGLLAAGLVATVMGGVLAAQAAAADDAVVVKLKVPNMK